MIRDPACTCSACNPPAEPWWQSWAAILPITAVAIAVCVALWTGRLGI